MDVLLAALADPARWRLVTLLAERPGSVGVLAKLTGLRQPQATKHLQTLERAGVLSSRRLGQRRVYALESGPLWALAGDLRRIADLAGRGGAADRHGHPSGAAGERLTWDDSLASHGHSFEFWRPLPVPVDVAWQYLTDASLLARWGAPPDVAVTELVFEPTPGGRIFLEYVDIDGDGDGDGADGGTWRTDGVVLDVTPQERIVYRTSSLFQDGTPAFSARVEFIVRPTDTGTELAVEFNVVSATVDADLLPSFAEGLAQSLDQLVAVIAPA